MTETRTETLVIGAGPGGYVAAIRLAALDRKAIVVERERVGGVCLNWGCIPTKALLHAVQAIRLAKEAAQMGIRFAEPEKDIIQLSAWRTRIVDRLVRGIEYLFKQHGIERIVGRAEFTDDRRVKVFGPDGSARNIVAGQIVIATGSEPSTVPGLKPDGRNIIFSNEALLLESIPRRLLIVGAGAIGLEFASVYAGLGSQVTVVELMPQVLPGTDTELANLLERSLRKQGINILLNSRVTDVVQGETLNVATLQGDKEVRFETDRILVATGRRPLTRGLGIEKSGVRLDARGYVATDNRLRTNRPHIFAIGDVARPPLLAHKASREGIVAAETICGRPARIDLLAVPACVFTDPELAVVGLTEADAQAAGFETRVGRMPLAALGRAATLNRNEGMCKVIADRRSDRVLGVQILAPEASALIGEAALAIEHGLTAQAIGRTTHPHPTMGELLMEAAEAVHRQAIHIFSPK